MKKKQKFWIHPASFTYRYDEPEKLVETIWGERPGWGYIRRRDLWTRREYTLEELITGGYVLRKPMTDGEAYQCPYCGMHISSIPGYLVHKHLGECGGGDENWQKIEEVLIADQRLKRYEAKILEQKRRLQVELEEAEKRERFDRIKDEAQTRQVGKDRKKRLKEETKEEWKRR
jgi:hypothetical protein